MQHAAAYPEDSCILVDRDGHFPVLVAFLCRAQKMLAPVFDPFHRPGHLQRRRGDHRLFGIKDRLGSKAAADIGRDHADRLQIAVEQIGQRLAAEMRRLRSGPDREQVGRRIVTGEHRARFHRHAAAAMLPKRFGEDVRGVRKGRVGVAVGQPE